MKENKTYSFDEVLQKAEGGDAAFQHLLARLYATGEGVEKSDEKCLEWLIKAAENGSPAAQYHLGLYYLDNNDDQKSFDWVKKSAEQGVVDAQYLLACFYGAGHGVEVDLIRAFEWCKKAAERGSVDAQMQLAVCYELGRGVASDVEQAAFWKKQAGQESAQA